MNRQAPLTKGSAIGMYKFAEWLRSERIGSRLSQRQLAEEIGVERKTLMNYETRKRAPRLDDICRLMERFGIEQLVIDIRDVDDKSDT